MPNIVASEVTTAHVYVKASDGSQVQISKETIFNLHNNMAQVDLDQTRAQVCATVCQMISDSLGASQVLPDQITFDYDQDTGSPTSLGFIG